MEPLVDIHWVSQYTGLAVSTLYKLTAQKRIKIVKLGRRVFFRPEDVEEFIANNIQEPVSDRV